MQLKILFILTLTRHVSAVVGHHQVFFTKTVSLQFVYAGKSETGHQTNK
jgi:hypothetical protein